MRHMAKKKQHFIQSANEQILGKGDLSEIENVFATNYVLHTAGKEYKGPAFVKRFVKELRTAIPDIKVVEIGFLVDSKDTIVWRRTLRGTHKAELKRIPPTNKKVEWQDMIVTRFENGKIAEEWAVSDLAGVLFSKFPAK